MKHSSSASVLPAAENVLRKNIPIFHAIDCVYSAQVKSTLSLEKWKCCHVLVPFYCPRHHWMTKCLCRFLLPVPVKCSVVHTLYLWECIDAVFLASIQAIWFCRIQLPAIKCFILRPLIKGKITTIWTTQDQQNRWKSSYWRFALSHAPVRLSYCEWL